MKKLLLAVVFVFSFIGSCFASDSFDMSVHRYAKYAVSDLKKNAYLTSEQKFALEQSPSDPATYLPLADYYYGIGEYEKSFAFYKKAGTEGSPRGAFMTGLSYAHGDGQTENMTECKKWLEMAVEGDHPVAAYLLAEMYDEGVIKYGETIAERNSEKAKQLFNQAAKWSVTKETFASESGYTAFNSKYNEPQLKKLTESEKSRRATQQMRSEREAMVYGGSVNHFMNSAYQGTKTSEGAGSTVAATGNAQLSEDLMRVLASNQAVQAVTGSTGNSGSAPVGQSQTAQTVSSGTSGKKIDRSGVIIQQPKITHEQMFSQIKRINTNKKAPHVAANGLTYRDVVKKISTYTTANFSALKTKIDADIKQIEAGIKANKFLVINRQSGRGTAKFGKKTLQATGVPQKASYYLDDYNIVRKAVFTRSITYSISDIYGNAYPEDCPNTTVVYFDKFGIPMKRIHQCTKKNIKQMPGRYYTKESPGQYVTTDYILPACNSKKLFDTHLEKCRLYLTGALDQKFDFIDEDVHYIAEDTYYNLTMRYYQIGYMKNREHDIFAPILFSTVTTFNGKKVDEPRVTLDDHEFGSITTFSIYPCPTSVTTPTEKDRNMR